MRMPMVKYIDEACTVLDSWGGIWTIIPWTPPLGKFCWIYACIIEVKKSSQNESSLSSTF